MSVPKFDELNKRSRQMFAGFYEGGNFSVKLKTKQGENDFLVETRAEDIYRVSIGSKVEASSRFGVQLQQKWNSDNIIFAELAFIDCFQPGVRLAMTGSFMPQSGQLANAFTANVMRNNVRLDMALTNEKGNVKCNNEVVMKMQNWLLGYRFGGPTQDAQHWLQSGILCLGYSDDQMELNLSGQRNKELVATLFQKVNSSVDVAVELMFDGKKSQLQLGCAYRLQGDNQLLAKLDTEARVGLGYCAQLSSGLKGKLWTQVDSKQKKSLLEACKLGLGLEFDI